MSVGEKVAKKVYVKSGQLEWVGLASGPLDAVKKALAACGTKTLDSSYFFIDERGFRDFDDAEYRVPVGKGLRAAGYVFDEADDVDD